METPSEIRRQLHLTHDNSGGQTAMGQGRPSPQMLGLLNGKLEEVFQGDHNKRISLLRWLWDIEESSKELTHGQVKATLDWLIDQEATRRSFQAYFPEGSRYVVSAEAEKACHAIIAMYCEEKGQMRLL